MSTFTLDLLHWHKKTVHFDAQSYFILSICRYAVANTSDALFIFGGYAYPGLFFSYLNHPHADNKNDFKKLQFQQWLGFDMIHGSKWVIY